MTWAKRIVLFLITNILVMLTISILLQLLGLRYGISRYGINYGQLMVFCLVWGMGGSFISLLLSRFMAKRMMGVQVIDPNTRDANERTLVEIVHNLARGAGLPAMPEVGYYDSPEVNAFATGPTRSRALVAVSSGLLQRMNRDEVEGVLGHEITHVANGDMVTLALIQGVVNTFVLFLARVIGYVVDRAVFRTERDVGPGYFITVIVAQIIFGILASIIVMWFSRQREFRADRGGATLSGRENMISALERLKAAHEPLPAQMAAFGIAGGDRVGGLKRLFMSHPPLDERIAALRASA